MAPMIAATSVRALDLLDEGADPAHSCQPVLKVLHRRERNRVRRIVEILDAAAVGERYQVSLEGVRLDVIGQLPAEQLVVELVGFRERRCVDRIRAAQEVAPLQVPHCMHAMNNVPASALTASISTAELSRAFSLTMAR